jgi:hypothetical protein
VPEDYVYDKRRGKDPFCQRSFSTKFIFGDLHKDVPREVQKSLARNVFYHRFEKEYIIAI